MCVGSHFPHDAKITKTLVQKAPHLIKTAESWVVRTMMMLWLSLAVLNPFQMGEELDDLISIAREKLNVSGKEGKSASILLASINRRSDDKLSLSNIYEWSLKSSEPNHYIGLVNNIIKDGTGLIDQLPVLLRFRLLFQSCDSNGTFPGETETFQETINYHIQCLDHRDTNIRWTAAKGLGKLVRLVEEPTAAEILDLLINFENHSADQLHGICLAVGQIFASVKINLDENATRKLTKFICDCLHFEVSKGTYAIGSNVRDAASFTCWAWCRYQPNLKKFPESVNEIAGNLLCLSIFDREISCRRAGSAAFQELVGRTSIVPHGIEIISIIDFFAISSLQNCYKKIYPAVLHFEFYKGFLLDHLIEKCCRSFDKSLRILATNAVGSSELDAEKLKIIFEYGNSPIDPVLIHFGLLTLSQQISSGFLTNFETLTDSLIRFSELENSKMPGYQLIAESWLTLLASVAQNFGLDNILLPIALALIKTALRSRFPSLHSDYCVPTLSAISSRAQVDNPMLTAFYRSTVLPAADKDFDSNAQRGNSAVIGTMPTWLLEERLVPLTNLLCRLANTKNPINDIEKRVHVINSIGNLHGRDISLPLPVRDQVFDCLILQLDDYSIDSRGDVGSFIREASMTSLCKIIKHLDDIQKNQLLAKILQQAVDRLDRVRVTAINLLQNYNWPVVFNFAEKPSIQPVYDAIIREQLLQNDGFKAAILMGWINSAGCPTPSVASSSWNTLRPYFSEMVLPELIQMELFWNPNHRLCKPLLSTLLKWAPNSTMELAEIVTEKLITAVFASAKSIHLLIDAVEILKILPCTGANNHIEVLKTSSPFPRIRQLCEMRTE